MKVSYNWLNKYFDGRLPGPEEVARAFTFHAWEIEEIKEVGDDTILDVKVLPDKAMWALSHRGIAKDLSVILDLPLAFDPLFQKPEALDSKNGPPIAIESDVCRRFAAATIEGVKVGPSPDWLRSFLESIGQRSINNIVDASNYVMFDLGQPSHAFDATHVGANGFRVRNAKAGEKLIGLDENEYTFTDADVVISRGDNDEILSIAGLKGGQHSGISDVTTAVVVEVANWDPVTIRKTGQRLKLRTDASSRYENGIVPKMVPYGLKAVTDLILEVAGGKVTACNEVVQMETAPASVQISLPHLNSVLGLKLSIDKVKEIIDRFGWSYRETEQEISITSPFERTDLVIPEDIIEEIGRIYGYDHVEAVTPRPIPVNEINQRFYYSEVIRQTLTDIGFSEIYTSSFRDNDEIKLANAFASDKGYLRGTLTTNMDEALAKNAPNADLLGLKQIRLFEIGTIFSKAGEKLMLCLGSRSPSGYKARLDDKALDEAETALSRSLSVDLDFDRKDGLAQIDLGSLLTSLPEVKSYDATMSPKNTTYKPYSVYPSMARDIAIWVPADTNEAQVEDLVQKTAGDLCVRVTLFDKFAKDERVSYAYRLVFQSQEKTLTGSEVDAIMENLYRVVKDQGFEVR